MIPISDGIYRQGKRPLRLPPPKRPYPEQHDMPAPKRRIDYSRPPRKLIPGHQQPGYKK